MHVVMHCMVVMAKGLCVCKHSNCAFSQWRNFLAIVDKAKIACENAGMKVTDHFADVSKIIPIGSGSKGFAIFRLPCYL